MAELVTLLRVFVSCPSDVTPEKQAVTNTIIELNRTLSYSPKIKLEVVSFENSTYPSLGSDPQSIINEQIDDEYDIYLGILWTRFGTQTPRAGSGTEEEFNRAYNKFESNRKRSRILFYFKNAEISPSELNLEQFSSVKSFQNKLTPLGLYDTFQNINEFERKVRIHLQEHIKGFGKTWGFDDPLLSSIGNADAYTPEEPDFDESNAAKRSKEEGSIKIYPSKKVYARINVEDSWRKNFAVRYPIIEGIESDSVLYKLS